MEQHPPQDSQDERAKPEPHARPVAKPPAPPAMPTGSTPDPIGAPTAAENQAVAPAGTETGAAAEPEAELTSATRTFPPAGPKRLLGTADLAFLARIPARKPETFDRDAIGRALWMVGGLALGLWIITLFARPQAPSDLEAPELVKEAPPIVLPGKDPAPPAFVPAETPPPPISLTPPPAAMTGPAAWPGTEQAPAGTPAARQPGSTERRFSDPRLNDPLQAPETPARTYPAELQGERMPAAADTPDPSNLFMGE